MDVEKVIRAQQHLAEEIERLLTNFGKAGHARKTSEYVAQKKTTLENLYDDFKENHAQLEAYLSLDHPYMSKDLFGMTSTLYLKALTAIESHEQKIGKKTATSDTSTTGSNIQPTANPSSIQYNLPRAADTLTTSSTVPPPINHSTAMFAPPMAVNNQFMGYLNNYPKLPAIKIPRFDGDYKEWKPFLDIFSNVIHNNPHLSNVEKMQYLLYHLEGDARKVISHLQLGSANYLTALQLIQARYNNNRRIITSYINTIMDIKKVEYRSQEDLIILYDTLRECLEALKSLNCQTDSWSPIVVCIAIRKLDPESLRLFEESLSSPREMPTIAELLRFLEKRHQVLDCIRHSKQTKIDPQFNKKKVFYTSTAKVCALCSKNHHIFHCMEFKKFSVEERLKLITKKGLCENCLSHSNNEKCKTKMSCFYCKRRHHTLLHQKAESTEKAVNHKRVASLQAVKDNTNLEHSKSSEVEAVTFYNKSAVPKVLLPTAIVRVRNAFGQLEQLRALIDPGSQVSLITEEAVQILKLQKQRIRTTILGVGDTSSTKANSKVNFCFQTRDKGLIHVEALVLSKLSALLPDSTLPAQMLCRFDNMILADPTFHESSPIDLLLGADIYASIIQEGFKQGQPAAQNTSLGWILFGTVPNTFRQTNTVSSFISLVEIDEKLERFWDMDCDETTPNEASGYCEEHYRTTHKRDNTGRYIVRLPFKNNSSQIGNSKSKAIARLIQMEKKLEKNPSQQEEYNNFLEEYQALGHMSPASAYNGEQHKVNYLPHHAVLKESSTTTKLRVVFDASSKSESQLSLNDLLHVGPKIQQDLRQILLRWRSHRYVFTADIEKMFRQIKVSHKDRNYQRILWRRNPSEPIQEFKLNTVTYGTAPATYLSVRTLKQLALDDGTEFPIAQRVLTNDFYVDDMLSGADTRAEAQELQRQIIALLKKGCFNLRKWTSNNESLLRDLPEDMIEKGILEIGKDDTVKTLGIHWNPINDEFYFKINFKEHEKLTKRILASKIASLFDPLGFLAPITITAKLIMQNLCKENVDWDEAPSASIHATWSKLEKEMEEIQMIKIPRWIEYRTNHKLELHGFCDASEKAYAAVIYTRTIDSFGRVSTTLLVARTRVTPLKSKPTLPRLELCGALLLAQLLHSTIKALELTRVTTYAWCDSEIVLAWITKNPATLEAYIANRVREIQHLCNIDIWRHVPSAHNPADVASRGISPNRLPAHNLWWKGPLWLTQPSSAWPIQKINPVVNQAVKEQATVSVNATTMQDILPCSTYTRQVRVTAYCLRFIQNCRVQKHQRNSEHLSSMEIQDARNCLIKIVQLQEFASEVNTLKRKFPIKKNSKLAALHPFIDTEGLLRVGGRIQKSALGMDAKHQILLPSKHQFTDMIIDHAHRQTLHGGVQQTLSYIRNTFWIIDGKRRIQSRNNKCLKCLRHRKSNMETIMGELPTVRVTPSPPFSHVGIDYAGPFLTKMSKGRSNTTTKGYVAVFVCMVTKAVHLELVTDLSSDAFLAAYKRFVARRGLPKEIMTDNGTNFVGAKNKMNRDLLLAIKSSTKRTAEVTAKDGTEWKFIPTASPHFGGLWEAAVKSMKYHLKRIMEETLLTYEEFTTVLTQVEACLNSRPIGQHSSDPTDLEPLTPGHFLIGRPLLAPPEPDISNEKVYQRWKLLTKLYQDIWKRWSQEYLTSLQQRTKWITENKNPSIGELVLVIDDNLAPQKWPLGRIVQLHPGEDGVVRIASVQFRNEIKKRPIAKLCQLPINSCTSADGEEQSKVIANIVTINKPPEASKCKDSPKIECRSNQEHFDRTGPPTSLKRKEPSAAPPTTKRSKTRVLPCTWAPRLTAMLSIFHCFTLIFSQQYEIFRPTSGFYIENLGSAQIKRGNLRLQLTYEVSQILTDQSNINATWIQIQELCDKARQLTRLTHCEILLQHLSVKKEELIAHIEQILSQTETKVRNKRGLFGNLLTSIFGVNDEVYTDIEALQRNQQDLLFSQNQQMLLLDTRLNQSNSAVIEKLKRFDTRLSQVVATINEMNAWFIKTDHNRVAIEVLATYLSAEDLYEELSGKYSPILNAVHRQGHLLDLISLNKINEAIKEASGKLGPNLLVQPIPQNRLQTDSDKDAIRIHGFLNIIERNKYNLIHVTPIPHIQTKDEILVADPKFSTFAIDFDQQTYFTLEESELRACSSSGKRLFTCAPTIIHDIQDSPSCVIDEIYERYPKSVCQTHQLKLKGTVWKALMMRNTWFFLTNETTTAGVFCNGKREEIFLNGTGVIHLGEGCYIKTREITLKSASDHTIDVVTSHMKEVFPSAITLNTENPPSELPADLLLQADEQLLQYSIRPALHPTMLRKAVIIHTVSAVTVTIIIVLAFIGLKYWRFSNSNVAICCRPVNKNPAPTTQAVSAEGNMHDQFQRVLEAARPPACSSLNNYAIIGKGNND